MTARAFDAIADDYDRTFTRTPVAQELRQLVWRCLSDTFLPGNRVWELNCGTGEDAVWLARRDIRVVASDASHAMLGVAAHKAADCHLSDRIEFLIYDLADPAARPPEGKFDGALSNFGGLNCIADLEPLSDAWAQSIRPGGHLVIVVMARWCAWEILWHLFRFEPRRAVRRLARSGARGRVGGQSIRVWYPTRRAICRALAPEFRVRRIMGLGVFLPPSYLHPVVAGRRRLFRMLCRLERSWAPIAPLRFLGDHVLYDFERTSMPSKATG